MSTNAKVAWPLKHKAPDILLPIGRKIPVVMNEARVPRSLRGQVSGAIRDTNHVREISHVFGGATRPKDPLLLYGPRGEAIMLAGHGDTEASEMQDMAEAALDRARERAKDPDAHFATLREKNHMPRKEDVPQLMRDALEQRVAHHKANPVTDPFRQPMPSPSLPKGAA